MNPSGNTVIRGDLNTYVEEVSGVDKLFIGAQVCPLWEVDRKYGQYPKFKVGPAELLNADVTARAPGGTYNRVIRDFDLDTYGTIDRGLEELVDDARAAEYSRYFDMEVQAAKFTTRSIMTAHEIRVANLLQTPGNFAHALTAPVSYTAGHLADDSLDFVGDVLTAIQVLTDAGYIPNAMVISSSVFTRVRRSKKLQNFMRGNRPSDVELMLTAQAIAQSFDLESLYIGRLPFNTAKKGKDPVLGPVWSNGYIWIGTVAAGDPYDGGAARTLVWNEEGGLWVTETYRDDERRSNIVRVRHNTTEKVIDSNSAVTIATNFA